MPSGARELSKWLGRRVDKVQPNEGDEEGPDNLSSKNHVVGHGPPRHCIVRQACRVLLAEKSEDDSRAGDAADHWRRGGLDMRRGQN